MRLLQHKEITVRRDCDRSEHVPAEHPSHLLVNTELVFLFFLIIILIEI